MTQTTNRALVALALVALAACGGPPPGPPRPVEPKPEPPPPPPPARIIDGGVSLQEMISNTTQRLQAVSVAGDKVVWASGTGGTWTRTTDAGQTWKSGRVPGADSLEFRDVQAFDSKMAYLLSSGPGNRSRIYRTVDGGENWQIQFINSQADAFFDCFAFWDRNSGIAFSDNVNGKFPVYRTLNGGQRWSELGNLPEATKGEGAFAASGTCVATFGEKSAWIATGAGTEARLLHTKDRGESWTSIRTPIAQGTSTTGHTSIEFRTSLIGLAVGGDIADTTKVTDNVIMTRDGGATWTVGGKLSFSGGAYGAAYAKGSASAVAVGPNGASLTHDDGRTWTALDNQSYWSVAFGGNRTGYMVGPKGRITKVVLPAK
jgi:photosystem II stability/assembly factor-like uncharacterized protein